MGAPVKSNRSPERLAQGARNASSSPAQARDNLIARLRDNWNGYYMAVSPHISYAIRKGTDFDTLEREARGALSLVKGIESEARTERDKIVAEMQGALEKVRQAAAVSFFQNEAQLHFSALYIHESNGVPGIDAGRCWFQRAILRIQDAKVDGVFPEFPVDLTNSLLKNTYSLQL